MVKTDQHGNTYDPGGRGERTAPRRARMPTPRALCHPNEDPPGLRLGPVRDWFKSAFPGGPTPAQRLAWPAIVGGENLLLVSPTGTGKTLAAFLAILDRLHAEHADGALAPGLRCVYVSPLRSLGLRHPSGTSSEPALETIRLEPSGAR